MYEKDQHHECAQNCSADRDVSVDRKPTFTDGKWIDVAFPLPQDRKRMGQGHRPIGKGAKNTNERKKKNTYLRSTNQLNRRRIDLYFVEIARK